jgi:hypothetical protein
VKTRFLAAVLIIGALAAFDGHVFADFIISPTVPSQGGGAEAPFLITQRVAPSVRIQELRSATDFAAFGSPLLMTEIAWTARFDSLPINLALSDVSIHFSTTPRLPSEISQTFADNIGVDEVVVYSGPLRLVDVGGEYGVRIQFQTPFYYDPSQGNLLMDFRNYETLPSPSTGRYLVNFASGFVPSVWGTGAGNVAATRGSSVSPGGIFTRFTVTPVPEPSTWLLLLTGVAALAFARRISKRTR